MLPIVAMVHYSKCMFQFVQLILAHLSKTSSRRKTELLLLMSEQSMATPGGINCNYNIRHLRSFLLCCAAALQPVLHQCPATFKGGDGGSGVTEALLSSSRPCLLCPAVLLCRVDSEPV